MKRAIVTGFGPYEHNPVQDLAREFDETVVNGVQVSGLVLPCTYYGAFDVLSERMDQFSPDIVINTGLASRVQRLRLEAIGRNIMSGKYPDADRLQPDNKPIVESRVSWYPTNADNIDLASRLYEVGIPAEISVDAEGFICNSLIYLTARRIFNEQLPVKHVFIHTLWTDDYLDKVELEERKVTIKKEDLQRAVEIVLNGMLRQ